MMLDNPAYADTNHYDDPIALLERSAMLINNPAYTTFKKSKLKAPVVMSGNPAYNTILEYNPTYFAANRLVISLDCI